MQAWKRPATAVRAVAIGAAAARAGVNVQTLRYYERRGLIAPARRDASGYRRYDADTITIVRGIKRAQRLGFTLAEIHELIRLRTRRSPARVRIVSEEKLRDLDDKLRALRRMRRALRLVLETCRCGGDVARCLVLDAGAEDPTARARRGVARRSYDGRPR